MDMKFNGSIEVTELLSKTLENAMKKVLINAVECCGERYGFDSKDALEWLNLDGIKFVKKPMGRKVRPEKGTTSRPSRTAVVKTKKVPLPFNKDEVVSSLCEGLNYNHGLFTQCQKTHMENGVYCVKCQREADQNASGEPNCGTISSRMSSELMEFSDPKGRKPTSYLKVLEKLNVSRIEAQEYAASLNTFIDECHFIPVPTKPRTTGRPKKTNKVVEADDVEDLFAKLTMNDDDVNKETDDDVNKETDDDVNKETDGDVNKEHLKVHKKEHLKAQEKEAKRLQKEAEKEAQRLQKEAEKAQKDHLKAQEKEQKRLQKEAEKEQKRLQKEAEKAQKAQKETQSLQKPVQVQEEVQEEEEEEEIDVAPFKINGKKYLKSTTNILYDVETHEPVAKYDPTTKSVIELDDNSDVEVEEEEVEVEEEEVEVEEYDEE
jgi:hypothetical protein